MLAGARYSGHPLYKNILYNSFVFFNVAGEFVSVWLRFQVCGICQFETEKGALGRGNDNNNKAAMAMRVHAGIFSSLRFSYKCSPEQGCAIITPEIRSAFSEETQLAPSLPGPRPAG